MRIVGLGASAGDLASLEQFLASAPAGSGLGYVVVQHLDPTHKAMLGELLQRATAMPVHEVADAQPVEVDTVYVIPPNAEISYARGMLRLTDPSRPRGRSWRRPVPGPAAFLIASAGTRYAWPAHWTTARFGGGVAYCNATMAVVGKYAWLRTLPDSYSTLPSVGHPGGDSDPA